jgi:hypothetical protein
VVKQINEPLDQSSGSLHFFGSTQDIPENGLPASFGHSGPIKEGEYLLTAAIRPDRHGKWHVTIAGPQSSSSFGIAESAAGWLGENRRWSTEQAGVGGTQVCNPSEPIVLLRVRDMKQTSPGSSSTTSEPSDGVMIWLRKP